MKENSEYIFTPLLALLSQVGYLAKDAKSLSYKLPMLLASSLFPAPPGHLTTLPFASHTPGYIPCAKKNA